MKPADKLEIPPLLQKKLEEFRSRLWSVKIGEGALAGIAGLIASFLVVFLLERFTGTPAWVRGMILVLGFAAPAIGIPIRYHRWVWRKRSLEQIARVLRKRYPRLGDELLGIVDLAQEASQKGHSSALVAAAMKQVTEKVADQDFADAVPENHYRKWLIASGGLAALTLLAIIFVSPAAQNSLARWMTPWRLIERYTFAWLQPVQREMIVPYAERFDLSARLHEETEWKPASGTVRLPGSTRIVSDRDQANGYQFSVPPQKSQAAIALRIGDARERIHLTPVTRPELDHLSAKVRLPEYLRYQRDPMVLVQGASIDLVEGASATFIGTANRELAHATVNGSPLTLSGKTFSTRSTAISGSESLTFEWKDGNGLGSKSPFKLKVNAIPDQAPEIFATRQAQEPVVLADEVITFDLTSQDDLGLREIGLEWSGVGDPIYNPDPAKGSKMVAPGAPEETSLEARGTFSARRLGIKPQTLRVRAYAEDYFPDRGRVYSPVFVIHVMEPTDHANWLTNEFSKWFNRSQEVYEREQQLHQSNRELRALDSEELESDENRARLERQAAAESSNSRRLEALTVAGRDLIRQATKNDEFDAAQLETWAQMMRALEEIAKSKMPSVADLLKKAAQAAANSAGSPERAEKSDENGAKDSPPSAPSVQNKEGETDDKKPDQNENQPPPSPSGPSVSDTESSLDGKDPAANADKAPEAPEKGGLGLPSTVLKGPAPPEADEKKDSPPSPTQENLDKAIEEQQELLTQFAKIANELQEILSNLEASTFVKRLKAASRRQIEIATLMNGALSSGFGISVDRIPVSAQQISRDSAASQEEESDKIYTIQSDLEAYFQRKQEAIYKNVLEQMKESAVISRLKELGKEAAINLNGRSISASEFWADTLDRWAEELVAAGESSEGQDQDGKQKNKKGLPPEAVLEIMKLAREEMELREETRELNTVKPSLPLDHYGTQVKELELEQAELRQRLDEVVLDLLDIPSGEEEYSEELQLLRAVSDIMREARGVLARPETGPEVIAAQTEAIELLLQTRRQPPQGGGGGGGGGGSPGGGGGSGNGGALSDIEVTPGGQSDPVSPDKRSVGQSTGKAGQEFPEEFRNGLDKYFNELERIR